MHLLLTSSLAALSVVVFAQPTEIPVLPVAKRWYKCELNTSTFNETEPPLRPPQPLRRSSRLAYSFTQESTVPLPAEAECAKFSAPLCYKGVCDSDKAIQLFVKRIPAVNTSNASGTISKGAVFIMDGGPGAASCDMEDLQQRTWRALNGTFDVYVHDPRGTGRSEMLNCTNNTVEGLPECLAALNTKYGPNAAGFSLTSAAADLVALTKSIDADIKWYMYGVSYGTLLGARTMHLGHLGNAFRGYILDGVTPERWDTAETSFNDVALRYLQACEDDSFCASRVKGPVVPIVEATYDAYDEPNGTGTSVEKCSKWLRAQMRLRSDEPTSFGLKKLFAWFIRSQSKQRVFPALLLRLARCSDEDFKIFTGAFSTFLLSNELEDNILYPYDSRQLNWMIEASEIMQASSYDDLVADFEADLITLPEYDSLAPFCLYHNSSFDECASLNLPQVQPFVYPKDATHDTFATIPDGASVLILNGVYDPITTDGWAQAQFDGFQGDDNAKALYKLDNTGHSVVDTPCGFSLYQQFLQAGGGLRELNTSCLDAIPPLPFNIPPELSMQIFGIPDAYAGLD